MQHIFQTFLRRSNANSYFQSTFMSKSNDEIVARLKTQQDSLAQLSRIMTTIPVEMRSLSDQIATILSFMPTLADTSVRIDGILTGVQCLQLESKLELNCKRVISLY